MLSQGFEEVSVEVVQFISSSVDFRSYVTIAEQPADSTLFDTHGVRLLEKYAREEDIQDLNDASCVIEVLCYVNLVSRIQQTSQPRPYSGLAL